MSVSAAPAWLSPCGSWFTPIMMGIHPALPFRATVLSQWLYAAIPVSVSARSASMVPVLRSRTQSPPTEAVPVRSVEAAMSAPVRSASVPMRDNPAAPAPMSQP